MWRRSRAPYAGAMQRVTARRVGLDAALILILVVATVIWSDAVFLIADPGDKVVRAFGSVDAWHIHVLWWSLAAVPSAVAIVLRHRWPLTATLMALGPAGIHLIDPIMKAPPTDLATLI